MNKNFHFSVCLNVREYSMFMYTYKFIRPHVKCVLNLTVHAEVAIKYSETYRNIKEKLVICYNFFVALMNEH